MVFQVSAPYSKQGHCQDEWATVQLRTISGKNWKDKVSHVELLQAVKFGTNQNFEWALQEDETKTPDLKSVETMIRLSRLGIQVMS